jgi:hypothetical protein
MFEPLVIKFSLGPRLRRVGRKSLTWALVRSILPSRAFGWLVGIISMRSSPSKYSKVAAE